MTVKFNHAHPVGSHYNKDDIAKFDDEVEKDLIERKIASKYEAKTAPKAAA